MRTVSGHCKSGGRCLGSPTPARLSLADVGIRRFCGCFTPTTHVRTPTTVRPLPYHGPPGQRLWVSRVDISAIQADLERALGMKIQDFSRPVPPRCPHGANAIGPIGSFERFRPDPQRRTVRGRLAAVFHALVKMSLRPHPRRPAIRPRTTHTPRSGLCPWCAGRRASAPIVPTVIRSWPTDTPATNWRWRRCCHGGEAASFRMRPT